MMEKISEGFKAAVAAAAGFLPTDKFKMFEATFTMTSNKAFSEVLKAAATSQIAANSSSIASLSERFEVAYKLAYQAA